MRFVFVSAIALAACTATDPPAFAPHAPTATEVPARPPDLAAPTEPPVVDDRYFLSVFGVDLLAVGPLTYWEYHRDQLWLPLPALLAAPLVHLAHGEPRKSGISFAMRAAMVGAVYLAGEEAKSECNSQGYICLPLKSLLISELAVVTVVVTDSILIARTSRPDSRWRVLPTITPSGVGVVGRF